MISAYAGQRLDVDLEKIIARIALEYLDQLLSRMIFAVESKPADHSLGFRSQIRDLKHRACIGAGGEQADEPQFARNLALWIERLHADVIHIATAVHQRFRIGLGDDKRFRAGQKCDDLRCCRYALVTAFENPHIGIAQDAKPPLAGTLQLALTGVTLIVVFSNPEEGEVVVAQPFEKFHSFLCCSFFHRRFAGPVSLYGVSSGALPWPRDH